MPTNPSAKLPHRTISADFCVIGGGISGLCAAVAAARHGLRTVLMHERPVLGGNASSEIRMWMCGADGADNRETGIIEEIELENLYRNPTKNHYLFDLILYDFARKEPNLTLLLNCTCIDAETETGRFAHGRTIRIRRVTGYQLTTQTFWTVDASFFADCSGDSILAPLTGAAYSVGREAAAEFGETTTVSAPDAHTMGMSCLIQCRETPTPIPYHPPKWAKFPNPDQTRGRGDPKTGDNFWYLELGGAEDSIHDTESIAQRLIPLAAGMWNEVKNSGRVESTNWELEFLGMLPGKRESRRMVGEYMLTQTDISTGRTFADTVAFGGWPLDDHDPRGFDHCGTKIAQIPTPAPYPIPYRVLYSANVDNLFFAGRNISATHAALSSTRVMRTCALLGQAVGTAAALAVRHGFAPHDVYVSACAELQQTLLADDCFLPGFQRDIVPLCQSAAFSGPDALRNGYDRPHRLHPAPCDAVIENGTDWAYRWSTPTQIRTVHLVFDSDLNRATLPGNSAERTHVTRACIPLDAPQMHLPSTLCRSYQLIGIRADETTVLLCDETENTRRAVTHEVHQPLIGLRLCVRANWGGTARTTVCAFDFAT